MNILITGATGFIGNHLLNYIMKNSLTKENKIILLTSKEISGYTCILHNNYTYTTDVFFEHGIDRIDKIIHLGGFVERDKEDRNSGAKNLSTAVNTKYLLDHLPNIPEMIIYCSTSAVYGEDNGLTRYDFKHQQIITEDTTITPLSLYSMAKYMGEMIVREWAEANGVIYHILRPSQVYGEKDYHVSMLIPVMMKRALAGEDLTIYGHPNMKRNYIYVDDCAEYIWKSLNIKEAVGPINLVSETNITLKELVELIIMTTGGNVSYSVADSKEYKGKDLAYDNKKCKLLLGNEKVSLADGLKKICDYYRRDLIHEV